MPRCFFMFIFSYRSHLSLICINKSLKSKGTINLSLHSAQQTTLVTRHDRRLRQGFSKLLRCPEIVKSIASLVSKHQHIWTSVNPVMSPQCFLNLLEYPLITGVRNILRIVMQLFFILVKLFYVDQSYDVLYDIYPKNLKLFYARK